MLMLAQLEYVIIVKLKKGFTIVNYLTKEYVKGAKYLGKSKAKISDLFEVKDD